MTYDLKGYTIILAFIFVAIFVYVSFKVIKKMNNDMHKTRPQNDAQQENKTLENDAPSLSLLDSNSTMNPCSISYMDD